MSFLPRFRLSIAPPTQGIAGPNALRPTQLCLDLGIECRNRGITRPCNSHQSVGVAGLSNPESPESESSRDGPESESSCDGPESKPEYPRDGPEYSETPANSKKKGSFKWDRENGWAMEWESIAELEAWLKEEQLANSIEFILSKSETGKWL